MFEDFQSIFIPIFKDPGRKSPLNFSEIKIHFTSNEQYEGKAQKVAINQLYKNPTLQIGNSTNLSLQIKQLPIFGGSFTL